MTDATSDLLARVQESIDEDLRPVLQADGGDVDLLGIDSDRVVQVRFRGTLCGCPAATMSLLLGFENRLKQRVPEVAFFEAAA